MNNFAQQLNNLRQQGGRVATQQPSTSGLALQEQLQQLYQQRPAIKKRDCDTRVLAKDLGAQLNSEKLLIKETQVALNSKHGFQTLGERSAIQALQKIDVAQQQQLATCHSEDIILMDTETTGLSGGTGTLIFQMGVARIKDEVLTVRQYLILGYQAEVEMLLDIKKFINGSNVLVTFNGKSFDQPLLATRCKLNNIQNIFEEHLHVDLLYPLRRAFSIYWDNCQLQTAEKNILNFHRKDDLPGAEVPSVWMNWLRAANTEKFNALLEHNYFDILSMLALSQSLAGIYTHPHHYNADISAIARHLDKQGMHTKAFNLLYKHRSQISEQGLLLLASLARRKKAWDIATNVWNQLSQKKHPEALERLAKYYEHVACIPAEALELTRLLRSQQPDNPEHKRRERRLLVKVQDVLPL